MGRADRARSRLAPVQRCGGRNGLPTPGPLGDESFRRRINGLREYLPDVVIVAGGINDAGGYPSTRVAAAADGFLGDVERTFPGVPVLVVSPFASGEPTRDVLELRDALEDVTAKRGLPFIDATPFLSESHVGSDGVHPTDAGHREIAARMNAALQRLDLSPLEGG